MVPNGLEEGDAALRALRAANDEVEALRTGGLEPADTRGYILRVANAVDRSLRRMLRDDEAADLSIRLKALAPDELRSDAVLAELRRNDRLPMDLAAGVHELLEARRRLEAGSMPNDADRTRAVRVADLLDRVVEQGVYREPARVSSAVRPVEEPVEEIHDAAPRRHRRSASIPLLPIALVLVVLLAIGGYWMYGNRGADEMEQGIALFRSGAYTEAAQHFYRYAQSNPRDPTPHLYLARIHRRTNRHELAAEAIRQAQSLNEEDPAVHRELGFLLLDTGRAEVAVDRFRHAIELDQTSSEAWVGLIRALRESGRGTEVERVLAGAPAEVRALLTQPGAM